MKNLKAKKKEQIVICPYCKRKAKCVKGKALYPHRNDLCDKSFWYCKPCGAYVGCHRYNPGRGEDGTTPLGSLANRELRNARSMAHTAFDSAWKSGKMSRMEAYAWLAGRLNIDLDDCHIALFGIGECLQVVEICFTKKYKSE